MEERLSDGSMIFRIIRLFSCASSSNDANEPFPAGISFFESQPPSMKHHQNEHCCYDKAIEQGILANS